MSALLSVRRFAVRVGVPLAVASAYAVLYLLLFAPQLLDGRLLAPLDGQRYFLPAYEAKRTLWSPFIFAGFPRYADPEMMTFYPPAIICSALGLGYNAFVILAYVIASTSSFFLARCLTGSVLASAVAGIVFGMGGFLMNHIAHVSFLHVACWLPLVLLALEVLKTTLSGGWFLVAVVGSCLMVLGGHPQISLYALLVATAYALFTSRGAAVRRHRYLMASAVALLLGVGVAALQVIPTANLTHESVRRTMSFEEFSGPHSLPWGFLLLLFFPFLHGGFGPPFTVYAGPGGVTWLEEFLGYVGLVPLVLAAVAVILRRRDGVVRFLAALAVVALVLALGDRTPLAMLLFLVPLYDLFRAPARHFFEFGLAVSLLAAYGVAALRASDAQRRVRIVVIALTTTACLMAIGLSLHALLAPSLYPQLLANGISWPPLPWRQTAIGIPFLVFALASVALICWARWPQQGTHVLLVGSTILDLASCALFLDRRYSSPRRKDIEAPALLRKYAGHARKEGARLMFHQDRWDYRNNYPLLWEMRAVNGYSSLLLSRENELMQHWTAPDNRTIDLLAARYITLIHQDMAAGEGAVSNPADIHGEDPQVRLGPPCFGGATSSVYFRIPGGEQATRLAQVSYLWGAAALEDGVPVVEIGVETERGTVTLYLRAGRDTADYDLERPELRSIVRHAPPLVHCGAPAFSSYMIGTAYMKQDYASFVPLGRSARVRGIRLRWIGPNKCPMGMRLIHLSLQDHEWRKEISLKGILAETPAQWRPREADPDALIFENPRALPRAWVVSDVRHLKPADVLAAVTRNRLPDGTPFDPLRTALVEEPVGCCKPGATPGEATAKIVAETASEIRIRTSAKTAAFLVISERFHPSWRAWIGGKQVPIVRTQAILRGVAIPAGQHEVRFEFVPTDLATGLVVSGFSLLTAVGVGLLLWRRGRPSGTCKTHTVHVDATRAPK